LAQTTLESLHGQTAKVARLDSKLSEIKENVKRSESYLKFISRHCVCFNCFVADPLAKEEARWENKVGQQRQREDAEANANANANGDGDGRTSGQPQSSSAKTTPKKKKKKGKLRSNSNRSMEKLPNVSQMRALHVADGDDLRGIQGEFVKQDEMVDEIAEVLTGLHSIGLDMGDELEKQNEMLDEVDSKATPLKDRMKDMNSKTKLSKIHLKKKGGGGGEPSSASTALALGSSVLKGIE